MIRHNREKDDDLEWIGNKPSAPFLAFGDDAIFNEILLYAFIVFPREQFSAIENKFIDLKSRLQIPSSLAIHTKDFLNQHKREKYKIQHLNVRIMIDEIINLTNSLGCWILYNYTVVPKSGNIYPEDLEINGHKIHGDRKAHAHILASSCFIPFLQHNGVQLSLREFEVFVSRETTKVKTVGAARRQAQFMSELRIPLSFPIKKDGYARLKPHYVPTSDYLFCQIADVFAYVISHALSKENRNRNYNNQMRRIKNLYRAPAG